MQLTLHAYIAGVRAGSLDPKNVLASYLHKATQAPYQDAYITLCPDYAQARIDAFSALPLAGAPIAVKDLILTTWVRTTCGSRMLDNYVPPFSATCFERLEAHGGVLIGKTNMDEFAMGASNETSWYGPVHNPRDATKVAGGSSWGSAAAVAGDLCIAALGTDTWGSVRQPASLCGVVGVKPTWWRVSRYGVQPMANSLDQVGVLTKSVEDAALLLWYLSGHDAQDATSLPDTDTTLWLRACSEYSLAGKRIAIPKQFFAEGLDPAIATMCTDMLERMKHAWAVIEWVDIPEFAYGIAAYYIINPAEVSTNLAKFDGIRFGLHKDIDQYPSLTDYYTAVRSEGFGEEAQRRILIWAYVLSAGHYDAYYRRALLVKQKIKQRFVQLFKDYDAVLWPTSPTVAWDIGAKVDDPVAMYLADIYTVIANLTGMPALSLPIGWLPSQNSSLPVGLQLMTDLWDETTLFGVASAVQSLAGNANRWILQSSSSV
jgi:aspartyl-tRNA(Asn)/glutamyl-tRNA(Gln) amidotransferase subunit A